MLLELAGGADGGSAAAPQREADSEGAPAGLAWPPARAAARRFACSMAGAALRSAVEQMRGDNFRRGWPLTPEPGTVPGYPELDGLLRGRVEVAQAGEWRSRWPAP